MQFFSDLSLFFVLESEVFAKMVRDNSCALVFSVLKGVKHKYATLVTKRIL